MAGRKLVPAKKPVEDDQPSNPESIKPDINQSTIDIFLGDAVANLSDYLEVAKKVLKPDEYSEEPDLTVPDLKILDPDSADTIKSTGFDPYDMNRPGYSGDSFV